LPTFNLEDQREIPKFRQLRKRADTANAVTQPEVARILNVSEDSIQRAQKVLKQGVPELIEKVERGEIEVKPAAKIAQASNFTIPSRAILTMKSCCIRL
jgi:transposase